MAQQPTGRRGRPSRASIHERLEFEVGELRARLGGLPVPAEAEDIWTTIWYQEAHNSTALEGNTLALREVEVLLSEGRVVGQKQLRDYMEVRGYADAAQWIYSQAVAPGDWGSGELLTLTEVREAHRRAMTPAWEVDPPAEATPDESPGNWRRHNIRPFPGGMQPPDHTEVPALMTDWVASVNAIHSEIAVGPPWVGQSRVPPELIHPPIAEAVARRHSFYERIHPFLDGNGRTGRLLTNLLLVRLGYPPAIIYKRERPRYLEALRTADEGDYAVAGPARLVPLEALATADLSVIALRNAAERGRLRAVRTPAGTWQSSKQWVTAYKASRYKALKEPRPRRRMDAVGS